SNGRADHDEVGVPDLVDRPLAGDDAEGDEGPGTKQGQYLSGRHRLSAFNWRVAEVGLEPTRPCGHQILQHLSPTADEVWRVCHSATRPGIITIPAPPTAGKAARSASARPRVWRGFSLRAGQGAPSMRTGRARAPRPVFPRPHSGGFSHAAALC